MSEPMKTVVALLWMNYYLWSLNLNSRNLAAPEC